MMRNRRPGNRAHLERLIDQWSKADDEAQVTAGRLRRLVSISVLASILDGLELDGEPRLAFKGGASLELRFGPSARGSRDVDALVNIGLDDAFSEISERLSMGWAGFYGTVGERTDIASAGISPAPQRCKIKLSYLTKPFATLPFELGRAEANSFVLLETIPNAVDLGRVQLDSPKDVVVLSVQYQIAQKLHACTEIPKEGANQRVHDLYDISLLEPIARSSGLGDTLAACVDTFDHRAKQSWPPQLTDWPEWPLLWDNLEVPDVARINYAIAMGGITRLIRDINRS